MKDNKFWLAISSPVSFLLLGACTAPAAAVSLKAGLAVGVIAIVILIVLSLVTAGLRSILSSGFRQSVLLLLAVALGSSAAMLLHAFLPEAYDALGIYVTLLAAAVALFVSAQAETDIPVTEAHKNAFRAGMLFLLATVLSSAVCEFFGSGSIWGIQLDFMKSMKTAILTQPAGRILVYGLAVALCGLLTGNKREEEK